MKKLLAIILSITLLFSFMAVPASAASDQFDGVSDSSSGITSLFERIGDGFHDIIAKIFNVFGLDCPFCENHFGYGEAGGEGGLNKAEVADKYNTAINNLKNYRQGMKMLVTTDVSYTVEEVSGVTSAVNTVIKNFLEDYKGVNYKNYTFKAGEKAKISAVVPPSGKEAKLDAKYVSDINLYNVDDKTKIDFKLMDADSHYDGTSTTAPQGFDGVIDYIDLAEIVPGAGVIKSADISYKNTSVEATIDVYNNIENLKISTDITLDITFELNGRTSQFKLFIDSVEEYEMTY